jgi:uncharacterized protein YkwD
MIMNRKNGFFHAIGKLFLPAFLLLMCLGNNYRSQAQSGIKPDSAKNMEEQILIYVNMHREELNLSPLVMNSIISDAAVSHSTNMATGKIPLGHDGFEERMGAILKTLKPANAAAENVADGNLNARQVVDLWLHSPGHRKNIEGDYNNTGIGIVKAADGKLYFTQIFIKKQ